MPGFETEKYRFWFHEIVHNTVHACKIDRVDRRPVTEEDENEIRNFFGDIGQWETFIKAGKSLLADLGIKIVTKKRYEREFGAEKYKMKFTRENGNFIKVTIELSAEERRRRTKGAKRNGEKLSKEEILNQVKNIPKWKTLMKAISAFKAP